MKNLQQLKREGYSICLPQQLTINTGIIGKLQYDLMYNTDGLIIHVARACDCLARRIPIVDGNGSFITSLDCNLGKKLVIMENDLNLWYALLQSNINDNEIGIEILNSISNKYLRF